MNTLVSIFRLVSNITTTVKLLGLLAISKYKNRVAMYRLKNKY